MFGKAGLNFLSWYWSIDALSSTRCMSWWENSESQSSVTSAETCDQLFILLIWYLTIEMSEWVSVCEGSQGASVSRHWYTGSLGQMDSNLFCGSLSSLSGIYNMLSYGARSARCCPYMSSCQRWRVLPPSSLFFRSTIFQSLHLSHLFGCTWQHQ